MKLSHIVFASTICMIAAFSGCGGSGTPLPASKVAKVTFITRTTAAQSIKGTDRINDYTVTGFAVPATLSAPVVQGGQKTILSNFLNSYGNTTVLGSYSTALSQPAAGKVNYSAIVTDTTSDIGIGPVADLFLIMGDQTLSKGTITSLLAAANPTMTARATLCPQNAPCTLNNLPKIDVFYNISVSIQTR